MEKLKRVVIKEELVALTGDYRPALLLNQLIYWSQRVSDFDKFIKEENERKLNEGMTDLSEPQNGWIYKTAAELSEELMVGMSHPTIRKYLKQLIENGWIDERKNPKYKWDKTTQYRVNITKIQKDLLVLGYALEGYRMPVEVEITECKNLSIDTEPLKTSNEKNLQSYEENLQAIPEITSEITNHRDKSVSQSVYIYNREKETDRQTDLELQSVNRILEEQIGREELESLKERFDADLVQEIELNISIMYLQDRTTIQGQSQPKVVIQGVLNKLNAHHIEDVLFRFTNYPKKIDNTKAFLQTMIYNAPLETIASMKNDIKATTGY
ncbi:MAG: DUF6017 domain-containing protein [Clostridium sp.]